jgi:hypothetical protein
MARKLMVVAVAVTVFGAAWLAQGRPAAAQTSEQDYRTAMKDLVELTGAWQLDLTTHLSAISVKPQLACTQEYQDHLRQGRWLADDLTGSALAAPEIVRDANAAAAKGFETMVEGAQHVAVACDGSALAQGRAIIGQGYTGYSRGIRPVRSYIRLGSGVRSAPRLPGLPKISPALPSQP